LPNDIVCYNIVIAQLNTIITTRMTEQKVVMFVVQCFLGGQCIRFYEYLQTLVQKSWKVMKGWPQQNKMGRHHTTLRGGSSMTLKVRA